MSVSNFIDRTQQNGAEMRDGWQMVSLYMRPDQHYRLRKLALEQRTSLSALVRQALEDSYGIPAEPSLSGVLPKGKKNERK